MRPLDPRLLRVAAGVRHLLIASVVLAVAGAAAIIAQAILLATVLADVIIGGQGWADVSTRVAWLAVVLGVRAGLAWAAEELARRTAGRVMDGLRRDLLRHVAALGPRWRAGVHSGELTTLATTGIDSLHDYVARYLPQLVQAALIPLIMLGYLVTADLTSAIIVAVTLPLIPLFMALVGWYTDRQTRTKYAALSRLSGHFADVVAGLPTLKVFGRAKAQAAAVRRVTEDYRRTSMATLRVAFLSSMVLELLASLSVALVAVAIGLRLVYGEMSLSIGLAVLILAPEAYLPLRQLGTQFHAAADGVAASAQVLTVLQTPLPAPGTRADLPTGPNGFRLVDATVGAPGERGTVGPLAFEVPAARLTVVTGPSGVGKTTLLQTLAGVVRPTSGTVTATWPDDPPVPVDDIAPDLWRSRLAWAGQGAWLRAGSIRDNLLLGVPAASAPGDDALRSVLTAVAADGIVDALPDGWHTVLGDGGTGLSSGQRQRLSLARALVRVQAGAPVLLLDEPTGTLDEATEARVLAGIAALTAGRTVVLVSHRAAPLAHADHVVDLTQAAAVVRGSDGPADAGPDGGAVSSGDELTGVGPW